MTISKPTLATLALMLIAGLASAIKYWDYLANPWTRNGMVRANVIQVTPRVSGPIVDLSVVDNQTVKVGDLLFRIDPRTYQAELDENKAELERTRQDYERGVDLVKTGDVSQRQFDRAKAAYDKAQANLESARLDLEFTDVRASAEYRRDMTGALLRRAVERLVTEGAAHV